MDDVLYGCQPLVENDHIQHTAITPEEFLDHVTQTNFPNPLESVVHKGVRIKRGMAGLGTMTKVLAKRTRKSRQGIM